MPVLYPKNMLKTTIRSSVGFFASGIRAGIKITGIFGYGNGLSATPYYDCGLTGAIAPSLNGTCNVNSTYNMLDPSASFTPSALVGLTIQDVTDGSSGIITINTATTCTVGGGLSGGIHNTWTLGDTYKIILSVGITATATILSLSAEGTIQAGHTLRIDTEQMYVQAVSTGGTKTATVVRGVNGTVAATHSTKEIYIYQYPGPVVESCLLQAARDFKRRESPVQATVGSAEMGIVPVNKGVDPDVTDKLKRYIKRKIS